MVRLADYVVSYLESIGVKDIFTVSGGGSIFLNDVLGQSNIPPISEGRKFRYQRFLL